MRHWYSRRIFVHGLAGTGADEQERETMERAADTEQPEIMLAPPGTESDAAPAPRAHPELLDLALLALDDERIAFQVRAGEAAPPPAASPPSRSPSRQEISRGSLAPAAATDEAETHAETQTVGM